MTNLVYRILLGTPPFDQLRYKRSGSKGKRTIPPGTRLKANRTHARRRALTLIEVLVVLAILLLLIILILTYDSGASGPRDLSPKTSCIANLHGIANGMATYAVDNNGIWPIAAHAPAVDDEVGQVTYAPGKIGTKRGQVNSQNAGQTDETDTEISITRNVWTLVRHGMSPKASICPSSNDTPNMDDSPQDFWDFATWNELSYGYQVPYGKHGQPNWEACPAEMVLMADKGPYGAALEAGAPHPGVPTPGLNSSAKDWSPWNSPNHDGEGQHVLFADGHVEWRSTPLAGVENDNIYTRWSAATGDLATDPTPRIHGTPPTSNETPWSDTDSLIYP